MRKREIYALQSFMPCIAFKAFVLYGPPMFFIEPLGMLCIIVHL